MLSAGVAAEVSKLFVTRKFANIFHDNRSVGQLFSVIDAYRKAKLFLWTIKSTASDGGKKVEQLLIHFYFDQLRLEKRGERFYFAVTLSEMNAVSSVQLKVSRNEVKNFGEFTELPVLKLLAIVQQHNLHFSASTLDFDLINIWHRVVEVFRKFES